MFFGKDKPATPPAPAQTANTGNQGAIFDVTTEEFEEHVIKGSMNGLVLVDFWAPWCGPCKQLMPVLEQLVNSYGGKVKLAKVNLDENEQLAAALRVQSVPTVYAFIGGRPVDAFQGVLPESQIRAFIDKSLEVARQMQPDALDIPSALKSAALALAEEDFQAAQSIYMQVLQEDEKNVQAFTGLVRVLIAAGEIEKAQHMVENAPPDISNNPNFNEARTALNVALDIPSGEETELAAKLDANENDHQTRFDLALAQFAGGKKQRAIENLLLIMEKDREWNEQAARHQLLKFFEALGHTDPLTVESRKRLSSILFS